jgi:hypothetical protein
MKRIAAIFLLALLLAPHARAGDADDVTKLAREFVVALTTFDFDKAASLGRPQDAGDFPKPPDEMLSQFRDLQSHVEIQDIRRQIADEVNKAVSLDAPAFTPDNTCAILTATPVAAEARKFCELMTLYITYVSETQQNKAQGLPMPKIEDIRTRIQTPGSPEQMQVNAMSASFPKQKLRLQLEKTAAGWRVNLHAFKTATDALSPDSP